MKKLANFWRRWAKIFTKKKIYTIRLQVDNENKIPVHSLAKIGSSRHSKPTLPYGTTKVVDDKTFEDLNYLSDRKEDQEREVVEKFVALLNKSSDSQLTNLKQLQESDNDFTLNENGEKIEVQLTEMSFRGIGYKAGDVFYVPNSNDSINLLKNSIERKIGHYQRPKNGKFWLVVYQLDLPAYEDKIIETARKYLQLAQNPFDAIWYFYLYSPEPKGIIVQVYPADTGLYNFKKTG